MSGESKGKEDGIRNPKYGIGGYREYKWGVARQKVGWRVRMLFLAEMVKGWIGRMRYKAIKILGEGKV